MTQARIVLDTQTAPSGLRLRLAAAVARIRARHQERRALVKLLSEWDSGIATGARGMTLESDPQV